MSGFVCETCGGLPEVHVTEVGPDGSKHEHHYCAEHAAAAGVPVSAEKIKAFKTGMEAFVQFVQRERRMPSEDELARLGVLSPGALKSEEHRNWLEGLRQMSEFIIQHPDA